MHLPSLFSLLAECWLSYMQSSVRYGSSSEESCSMNPDDKIKDLLTHDQQHTFACLPMGTQYIDEPAKCLYEELASFIDKRERFKNRKRYNDPSIQRAYDLAHGFSRRPHSNSWDYAPWESPENKEKHVLTLITELEYFVYGKA